MRCSIFGRSGQYSEERFFDLAGNSSRPDALLPFARHAGWELAQKQDPLQMHDRCGIRYVVDEWG